MCFIHLLKQQHSVKLTYNYFTNNASMGNYIKRELTQARKKTGADFTKSCLTQVKL